MESESTNHISLDCLICLDLLCEPITTNCGHSFCKYCFISYLKSNNNCPVCRKQLYIENTNSLSKNILLSEIAKSKNPELYEERKKSHSFHFEKLSTTEYTMLYVYFKDLIFPPGKIIDIVTTDVTQFNTIHYAYFNNQSLIISSKEEDNVIASSCKILEFKKIQNEIKIKMISEKRFLINSIIINDDLSVCKGNIIQDKLIIETDYNDDSVEDEEKELRRLEIEKILKDEIIEKSIYIVNKINEILKYTSISISRMILSMLNQRYLNTNNLQESIKLNENDFCSFYEGFIFMILNSINLSNEDKYLAYKSQNLYRKIDNLWNILNFYDKDNLITKPSFALEFFDYSIDIKKDESGSKFCIFLVLLIIALVLLTRYEIIHMFRK